VVKLPAFNTHTHPLVPSASHRVSFHPINMLYHNLGSYWKQ